jgi:hypothetical protein
LIDKQNRIAASRTGLRPARSPALWSTPLHLAVEPDQQRAPSAQRRVVLGPGRRAVADRCRPAHARASKPPNPPREPPRSRATQQRRFDPRPHRSRCSNY